MTLPHLCHVHPSFGTGGPEVRTSLIIDASRDAFRHTVVALDGNLEGRGRVEHRGGVRFLEGPRVGGLLALARLLHSLRPDLVLTYGWGGTDALLAARLGGLRRVVHSEDGFLPDEATRQRFARLLARRVLLRLPRLVVCPSRTLVRIAIDQWWLPADRVQHIPNGVDVARFAPGSPQAVGAARRRIGCSDGEVVVGTVGRLGSEKNHARLLRAFAALAARRPARLVLVGDGPLRGPLGRLAEGLGLGDRVLLAGQSDRPEDYYRAMDLFALSSDTEQMPIALLEAMAAGLPVLSTDVGDVRDMVSPANKPFVIPVDREDDFATALGTLAGDSSARASLGRANREKCSRHHRLDAMCGAYIRLYRDSLG